MTPFDVLALLSVACLILFIGGILADFADQEWDRRDARKRNRP